MKVLPSGRLLLLAALVAPLFFVSGTVAIFLDLVLLAAATADAALAGAAALAATRSAPRRLAQGAESGVTISVVNGSPRPVRLRVTDDLPPQLQRVGENPGETAHASTRTAAPDDWETTIPAGETSRFEYRIRGVERGTAMLGDIHLRILGPLGLIWRQRRELQADEVRIQPGLLELRRYRLLAHRHRLREMGLRSMPERGEGSSFESLREYVRGDDPRRLDWKATGKRGTLIIREMEAERSQNVVLAIDAGRLMTEELANGDAGGVRRERLDSALSAALLLAQVAAQHGDRVGLFVFSDRVQLFLPPARTPLDRVAGALAGVQARLVEPDYPGAFTFLSRQLRRRSLLVLFTDVIDARASAALLAHAGAATRRHLPLAIAIRNPALEVASAAPAPDVAAVYRRAAAEELLQLRGVALAMMRRSGVLVADIPPDQAVPTAVNRYLEIKRRGRV